MNTGKEKNVEVPEIDMDALEKSFDASVDGLRAELGIETDPKPSTPAPLKKGKSEEMKGEPESSEDEDDEDEDGEEEGYEETAKSLEALIQEDPESEVAMDVEPFLRTFVKSIDKKFNELAGQLSAEVITKLDGVVNLVKSQAGMLLAQAELQKSINETTRKIGEQPIPSASVKNKTGERFAKSTEGQPVDFSDLDPERVDTFQWLQKGLISPTQATVIDNRLSKNALFKTGDSVDQLVKSLMTQEAK